MANILDYIKWRGDLSFEQSEFNEVDSVIMARLSYFDYDGVFKAHNEEITIEEAYRRFHEFGFAVSVEAFCDGQLAGGLYGVMIGKCFFGESMYSDRENGSKLALICLARLLERNGFVMIDCQFHTDHLESMGGIRISYEEYGKLLNAGLGQND